MINVSHMNTSEQDALSPILAEMMSQIKMHRKMQGVSQSTLSLRSNVTQNIISRSERGLSKPTFTTINKLMDALDLEAKIELIPKDKQQKK